MNERDAYQLARAFAEVMESRRRGYEYACVSVQAVRALTAEPKYPDAYVSEDADTAVVRDLLERGFRWIRTEEELAVFEKEVPR
jgi:hypothetical protein